MINTHIFEKILEMLVILFFLHYKIKYENIPLIQIWPFQVKGIVLFHR